ncbi:MAG: hypothetical protein ACR2RE_17875, partial [Geminicoccaceae bacterium]
PAPDVNREKILTRHPFGTDYPPGEKLDDREDGHGFGVVDQPLEVFGETTAASEPAEGPFDQPASDRRVRREMDPDGGACWIAFGNRPQFQDLRAMAQSFAASPLGLPSFSVLFGFIHCSWALALCPSDPSRLIPEVRKNMARPGFSLSVQA